MANVEPDDGQGPQQAWAPSRVPDGGRRRAIAVAALACVALLAAVAFAVLAPPDRGSVPLTVAASSSLAAGVDATSSTDASPSLPVDPIAPPAAWVPGPPGRIAYVGPHGVLTVVDDETGATVTVPIQGLVTRPPAWSPDGTRIAVIAATPGTTGLSVVDMPEDGSGGNPVPKAVYVSADEPPFYLYWAPDGKRVGFLASDADGITLRTAPADGTGPTDGSRHDGILRQGAPLYFTWEDANRLLLHVGAGVDAFAGDIGLDGTTVGPVVPGTGDFRAAAASRDGMELAYVHGGAAPEIVLQSRDGTNRRRLPVFGPAAIAFDPAGTALATLAADTPPDTPTAVPFGPLRVLDPGSGDPKTLIDGSVVAFYWSPDGRTIAALRLAPVADPSSALRSGGVTLAATTVEPAASPAPAAEVHLTFVDAATGSVRSDRVVRLGDEFVATILPYFDQYALSHRVWSPDGRAVVLPLKDATGVTHATVLDADGGAPRPIAEAISSSWAP